MNNTSLIHIEIIKDDNGNIMGVLLKVSAALADVAVAQIHLAEFLHNQAAQISDKKNKFPAAAYIAKAFNVAREQETKK